MTGFYPDDLPDDLRYWWDMIMFGEAYWEPDFEGGIRHIPHPDSERVIEMANPSGLSSFLPFGSLDYEPQWAPPRPDVRPEWLDRIREAAL